MKDKCIDEFRGNYAKIIKGYNYAFFVFFAITVLSSIVGINVDENSILLPILTSISLMGLFFQFLLYRHICESFSIACSKYKDNTDEL